MIPAIDWFILYKEWLTEMLFHATYNSDIEGYVNYALIRLLCHEPDVETQTSNDGLAEVALNRFCHVSNTPIIKPTIKVSSQEFGQLLGYFTDKFLTRVYETLQKPHLKKQIISKTDIFQGTLSTWIRPCTNIETLYSSCPSHQLELTHSSCLLEIKE
jgi:hypothetical protein